METGFAVLFVLIGIVAGIIIGIFIAKLRNNPEGTQGTIYAYFNDPESNPSLLLEYSVPIDDIASRKQVTFDVMVIR